ncbi:hypothetical protein F5878DRAFT_448072 [Lentinula raphanica]|uniref:Uncharacterized protein n=1 Tax=Lentinula raphanica TaxID=153919 RepID=A0AA38NXX1_9AGAR|nr:hypothetical protein F5878DRAFT_448072 [Lentinula raphanica]
MRHNISLASREAAMNMELFVQHVIFGVPTRKPINKVLKLLCKLDCEDADTCTILFKIFTKPWKLKFRNISLMAMLMYDLQCYQPAFS